jgi:hypothetical protein
MAEHCGELAYDLLKHVSDRVVDYEHDDSGSGFDATDSEGWDDKEWSFTEEERSRTSIEIVEKQ